MKILVMQDWIKELMRLYEQDCPESPTIPDEKTQTLRHTLVTEELGETISAMKARNLAEIADGFADVLVVTFGTHNAYGVEARNAYNGRLPSSAPHIPSNIDEVIARFELLRDGFADRISTQNTTTIKFACDDIAEAVCDAALEFGIDIQPVFMEVHWSNKTKFDENGMPIKRADGKVIKGPFYKKADVAGVLELQTKYYLHSR